jgi:hypothetical protein
MKYGVIQWWPLAAVVALVAGCGGGGGGSAPEPAAQQAQSDDQEAVMLAVGLFDSVAGVERVMTRIGGFAALEDAAGATANGTCAGGGSATFTKTTAMAGTLTAANCRLRTDDGLVYNGSWTFNITASSFPAAGGCVLGNVCTMSATIDTSAARFGYGTATEQVYGAIYSSTVNAAGVRTADVGTPGQAFNVDGINGIINASIPFSTLEALGVGQIMAVRGTRARDVLTMTVPFNATIALGTTIEVAIDRNGDGTYETSLSVPWSSFVD